MKKKILVICPSSLTGSRFIELAKDKFEIIEAGSKIGTQRLDLTNPQNVEDVITNFPGKFVVNFAGATLVDEIEKSRPRNPENELELNQNLAYQINVLGTRNLAQSCKKSGKYPIFISTGFVFDGENGPYNEVDPVATSAEQVSWYGWTKVLAEREVADSGVECAVLRISYPYRSNFDGKADFARSMLKIYDQFKSGERDSIYPMFSDQKLTPTFIDDLLPAINLLISKNAKGIFHLTSPEVTTPYDFCLELLKKAREVENPSAIIKKGSIIAFQNTHPEIARRPVKGGERVDKIIQLGFTPTSWKDGIQKAFA